MVVFNYSGSEINAKIVYYGPALSGKTTNLEDIYEKMPSDAKGKLVSMKTRTDRTLFFDFLPVELGDINNYKTRLLLYTVPGQVYYNATRKLVLKGADAVVFVADSSAAKMDENIESLRNLEENLNEHGLTLDTVPWVIQYNKRDLPDALPIDALNDKLNLLNVPTFEAVASEGDGIYETFQGIAGILYNELRGRLEESQDGTPPASWSEPAISPATPHAASTGAIPNPDSSVADVVDVALREVDGPGSGEKVDLTAIPRSAPVTPMPRPENESPDQMGAAQDVTAEPSPPPVDSVSKDAEKDPADKSFAFESINESQIDNQVGRVVDLEETPPADTSDSTEGEFIINPFHQEAKKKPSKAKVAPEPSSATQRDSVSVLPQESEAVRGAPDTEREASPSQGQQPPKPKPEPSVAQRLIAKLSPKPRPKEEEPAPPEQDAAAVKQPALVNPTVAAEPLSVTPSQVSGSDRQHTDEPAVATPEAPPSRPAPSLTSSPSTRREPASPASDDECAIRVPITLSRSDLRKSVPIKLTIDIQVDDDDD